MTWMALIFLATSSGLLGVADHGWSEPLFIVAVVLEIGMLGAALRRPEGLRLPTLAGVVTGIAVMLRYAGLSLGWADGYDQQDLVVKLIDP